MNKTSTSRNARIATIAVALLLLSGAIIIALNWSTAVGVLRQANWFMVPMALLFTAASYVCASYSFFIICRIFGIKLEMRRLVEIGFVSTVVDNLLATGGIPGLSMRVILLRHSGINTDEALAPSFFRSYFNNIIFFALLPLGLIGMVLNRTVTVRQSFGFGIAAGILITLIILSSVLVFITELHRLIINALSYLWRLFFRRDIRQPLLQFDAIFKAGIERIKKQPGRLIIPLLFTAGDWTSTLMSLWFCFRALGGQMGFGVLTTGFVAGVTAGIVSFIPGGLGVQDAGMAGIYALFGVPLAVSVLAAILFRVVYYFMPFMMSLIFYRHLLRTGT